MLLVATLVIAAGAAVLTPAQAAAPQLSDVAYMQAAHCAGLAEGAKHDTHYVDALLNTEEGGRMNWIIEKAQDLRTDAVREARRANSAIGAVKLSSDLNACSTYLSTPSTTAVATAQ